MMPFNQSRPRVAELAGEEDGVEDGGGFIIYDSRGYVVPMLHGQLSLSKDTADS